MFLRIEVPMLTGVPLSVGVAGDSGEVPLCGRQHSERGGGAAQRGRAAALPEVRFPGVLLPCCHTCRHRLLPSQDDPLHLPGGAAGLPLTEVVHQGKAY